MSTREATNTFKPSRLTRVRRRAGRGKYDWETIHAILDEGLVAHVGFAVDEQPFVIPMLYARDGDELYLHGSPLSRLVRGLGDGVPICMSVTLLDGLVLARSAFHHSLNYRSVVVLGSARPIEKKKAKLAALEALVEHVAAGRTSDARAPNDAELDATEVLVLPLAEASAKIRTGPPVDAREDRKLSVWAGELPLRMTALEPRPDCDLPLPDYLERYARGL